MAEVASARICGRCGTQLSRYNLGRVCATCEQDVVEAPGVEESDAGWLDRADNGLVTDDAGAVLRAWREINEKNQVEVAALLNTTQQHLSQMENRQRPVSLELRRRISDVLGIPPDELGLAGSRARRLVPGESADRAVAASQVRWRAERRWLNQHRSELAQLAVQLYPAEFRVPGTTLIARPDWLPARPIELRSLRVQLDEDEQPMAVLGSEPEAAATRPLRVRGERFERYTSAVKHLDPPRLFESRPSYRLLNSSLPSLELRFGMAAYFDKLDVSETIGHELAAACMASGVPALPTGLSSRLPFRDLVGDPFDPMRRAVIPAITTLTLRLRRYPAEPSFLLHWRDPANVATAAGVYDVIPAGEFQPSSVAQWDRHNDFDLWRNVVREYSEELLGSPEHDGTRSQPINYLQWPLYQQLEQAQATGSVSAWLLGVGVDALTLAATILTVVVIDDDTFGDVFGSMVRYNDEGEIVAVAGGTAAEGVPFTEVAVHRLLDREPMAAPGAACLALAWRHRAQVLGL